MLIFGFWIDIKIKKIKNIIIYIFIGFSFGLDLQAQENDYWFLFQDDKTNLLGYKDSKGNIKIEPKFTGLTSGGNLFKNIIPVSEKKYMDDFNNYESINYYLLKDGRKVGINSSLYRGFQRLIDI